MLFMYQLQYINRLLICKSYDFYKIDYRMFID